MYTTNPSSTPRRASHDTVLISRPEQDRYLKKCESRFARPAAVLRDKRDDLDPELEKMLLAL